MLLFEEVRENGDAVIKRNARTEGIKCSLRAGAGPRGGAASVACKPRQSKWLVACLQGYPLTYSCVISMYPCGQFHGCSRPERLRTIWQTRCAQFDLQVSLLTTTTTTRTFCISSLCSAVPIMMELRHAREANMAMTLGNRMLDAFMGTSMSSDASSRMSRRHKC